MCMAPAGADEAIRTFTRTIMSYFWASESVHWQLPLAERDTLENAFLVSTPFKPRERDTEKNHEEIPVRKFHRCWGVQSPMLGPSWVCYNFLFAWVEERAWSARVCVLHFSPAITLTCKRFFVSLGFLYNRVPRDNDDEHQLRKRRRVVGFHAHAYMFATSSVPVSNWECTR